MVALRLHPRSWQPILDPFGWAKEGNKTLGLWLRVNDCSNGPAWVAVDLLPGNAMFMMRGWKSFDRSRDLGPGYHVQFKFDGSAMLSVKFLGTSGNRL
ncbi:l-ascorbate oxidase-like protein [Hordeum vulgare]|nr:l-ascorbate oxidase-like protein [Hordeum vulgare]